MTAQKLGPLHYVSDVDDPAEVFAAQVIEVIDEFVAQCIRNDRRGRGKGLRAYGMDQTADLLEQG